MVGRRHQQSLGRGIKFQRRREAHVQFPGNEHLGLGVGKGRTGRQRPQAHRAVSSTSSSSTNSGCQTILLGGPGVDGIAEQQESVAFATRHPGQQVGGADIRAGEPDLGEQDANRAERPSTRRSEASAGRSPPQPHTTYRRDDRQRCLPHRADDLTGHAGERSRPSGFIASNSPTTANVTARADAVPSRSSRTTPAPPGRQRVQEIAQIRVGAEGQRVQLVGPVRVIVAIPSSMKHRCAADRRGGSGSGEPEPSRVTPRRGANGANGADRGVHRHRRIRAVAIMSLAMMLALHLGRAWHRCGWRARPGTGAPAGARGATPAPRGSEWPRRSRTARSRWRRSLAIADNAALRSPRS